MSMRTVLLAVSCVLSLGWNGCATHSDPAADEDLELAALDQPIAPTEGGPVTSARTCTLTCPAAFDADPTASCGSFVGVGRTTFLGSCSKACGFATQDARDQALRVSCHLSGPCSGGC
jgi:hypothetical protein